MLFSDDKCRTTGRGWCSGEPEPGSSNCKWNNFQSAIEQRGNECAQTEPSMAPKVSSKRERAPNRA